MFRTKREFRATAMQATMRDPLYIDGPVSAALHERVGAAPPAECTKRPPAKPVVALPRKARD